MMITEEQLTRIASGVLQAWNGNAGFPPEYWRTRRGQAILSAIESTVWDVALEASEDLRNERENSAIEQDS